MASGIAHDFNNNLMPILGFSELLTTDSGVLDDKERVHRYLVMINMAAKDAVSVISRLREFYRKRGEEDLVKPVNINELVAQAISLTQTMWKDTAQAKGVNIRLETDLQETPAVTGNESEIREALVNLILNAADAIPEDGTITIRTRRDGEHIALEVSDTGIGMTEEVRHHCLDPFFTTKGHEGTGMGLPMVYGTVQRHEGTIQIESEVGNGTTFTIRLPFQARSSDKRNGASARLKLSRKLHVLVVEDEPRVRQLVAEYLSVDGHSVETATNGREGLKKFRAGTFDLVITDRAMPEVNGDQLAAAIKEESPSKPVILLTGFGDIMEATDDRPVAVDLVVGKPVTLSALQQAVAKVVAEVQVAPQD